MYQRNWFDDHNVMEFKTKLYHFLDSVWVDVTLVVFVVTGFIYMLIYHFPTWCVYELDPCDPNVAYPVLIQNETLIDECDYKHKNLESDLNACMKYNSDNALPIFTISSVIVGILQLHTYLVAWSKPVEEENEKKIVDDVCKTDGPEELV